jgi:hypothetical protein
VSASISILSEWSSAITLVSGGYAVVIWRIIVKGIDKDGEPLLPENRGTRLKEAGAATAMAVIMAAVTLTIMLRH